MLSITSKKLTELGWGGSAFGVAKACDVVRLVGPKDAPTRRLRVT